MATSDIVLLNVKYSFSNNTRKCKYKNDHEFKNLCEEIKVAFESNQGCHVIKRIIELWEIGTGIFPDALIDEWHKLQYITYYRYIKNNPSLSENVRNNPELSNIVGIQIT